MSNESTKQESTPTNNKRRNNSAIVGVALVTRQKELRFSIAELKQHFDSVERIDEAELTRGLQELEIKSRWLPLTQDASSELERLPLPGIVELKNGEFAVLMQANEETALVQVYGRDRAESWSIADFFEKANPSILLLTKDDDAKELNEREFGWSWFFKTIMKYKSVMRETLFASFFIQIFALVTPLFFMIIIDKVFSHNNLSTLDVLVFAMIVVAIFDVILNGIRTYLMSHTTNRVDLELGARSFKHMMRLPLSYFESRRSGETIARMREMDAIRNFLTGSTLTLLIDLLFLGVFLLVMFLFSKTLFMIVLVALPLFFLVSFFITPLMRDKLEDKHQKLAENQSFMVEALGGIETIKSSSVEPHYQREYENRLSDLSRTSFNSSNLANLINQTTSLISKTLTIILLYVGANLVLAGELSVGQLIAFNMLTARVIQPIQRLAQIWQEFTGMKVSMDRVGDIMKAPVEPMMLLGKTESPTVKGEVEFHSVSFAYGPEAPEALTDINLKVAAGEVIGVVGSTGSGKTTLVKLVQRLYVPTKGKITIDGVNTINADGALLRKQIGVVAQDFVLFNRSIRDNIALGDYNIDDEKIVQVAEHIGVHKMIMQLPEGYDTVLQERGRGLSTGQRQGIALARALVTDPAILILDEATSAMDYESEQVFQSNFATISEGRTTFVVAHRLSTVRHADRIITIEHGCIVEDDTPTQLLANGGRFAKLYDIHQNTLSFDRSSPSAARSAGVDVPNDAGVR